MAAGGALPAGPGAPGSVFAAPAAPTLTSPAVGATLNTFGPTLTWSNPGGATQYHLQVIPANNDGPGVDLHIGSIGTSFRLPPPPSWYGLLPDMTYTWRVRVSDARSLAPITDPSWGPWAERTFRTPTVFSTGITALTPATGDTVTTLTPALQWDNNSSDVFLYEVQLSKDPSFHTGPPTATATVHTAVVHGGVTAPARSYQVPSTAPLEDTTTYYWRVRPRVQGDAMEVAWSAAFSFRTDRTATPALGLQVPVFGTGVVDTATCTVDTAGTIFAANPTFTGIRYAYSYTGTGTITQNWSIGERPVLSAVRTLPSGRTCASGALGLPGSPDLGVPFQPGPYLLELWAGGQRVQSATFTVTPSSTLQVGPLQVGTGTAQAGVCALTGVSNIFAEGTPAVYIRFNTAGAGPYTVTLSRGGTVVDTAEVTESGPANCSIIPVGLPAGTGDWAVSVTPPDQLRQQVSLFRVR